VQTEQLNEVLGRRVLGVCEESTLYQHALLLNVYMLFSSFLLFNWLINLFFYLRSQNETTAYAVNCDVPENIHIPPMEGFFSLNPTPLWKFHFSVILSFKKLGF